MADAERCITCGAIIPEGRLTCPLCDIEVKIRIERRESLWKRLRRKFLGFWKSLKSKV